MDVAVPKEVLERVTDSRGRLTLGSEYADQTVTVAVLDTENGDTDE